MSKEIFLKLVRISNTETDSGAKDTFRFVRRTDEVDISLSVSFLSTIAKDMEFLAESKIGDRIKLEIGSDTRQERLKIG